MIPGFIHYFRFHLISFSLWHSLQALAVLCCTDAAQVLFQGEGASPPSAALATGTDAATASDTAAHGTATPGPSSRRPSPQLARVAMALLGEAVSRGCRVLLKAQTPPPIKVAKAPTAGSAGAETAGGGAAATWAEEPYRRLLRQALGIRLASCVDAAPLEAPEPDAHAHSDAHSDAVDLRCGAQASGHFFGHRLTNCTPWAIVACLGWAETVWRAAGEHAAAERAADAAEDDAEDGDGGALAAGCRRRASVLDRATAGPQAAALRRALAAAAVAAFDAPGGQRGGVSMRRFARRFFAVAAEGEPQPTPMEVRARPQISADGCFFLLFLSLSPKPHSPSGLFSYL